MLIPSLVAGVKKQVMIISSTIFENELQTFKSSSGKYTVTGNVLLLQNSCELLEKQSAPLSSPCYQMKKRPVAHEFGHMIGLIHPGGDDNSLPAYEADATALMGCGNQLRAEYFEKWRQILEGHRKECCGSFIIGTND